MLSFGMVLLSIAWCESIVVHLFMSLFGNFFLFHHKFSLEQGDLIINESKYLIKKLSIFFRFHKKGEDKLFSQNIF